MSTLFAVPIQTKYGDTVYTEHPRSEAYKQLAQWQIMLHLQTSATFHEDGAVTCVASGLAPITFAPEGGLK